MTTPTARFGIALLRVALWLSGDGAFALRTSPRLVPRRD